METKKSNRLYSLDALRGFDMFFIIGGAHLIKEIAKLFPSSFMEWVTLQMNHVGWHGFQHHDIIFPLFLFIAGVSFPFSLANKLSKGETKSQIYQDILRRGALLFLFGILYNNGFSFDFPNMRYMSVLGRIGLAWMFAAMIYVSFKQKFRLIWMASILIGYYLIMAFIPAPDAPAGTDIFSPEGNFAGWVDRLLLYGRWAGETQDAEGIFSTIPAIVTALMGMQAGRFLKWDSPKINDNGKTLYLLAAGVLFVVIGSIWDNFFPINKKLWSSSFVCYVGGLSLLHLALFYYIIDVLKYQKWAFFFKIIGVNSITIYMAGPVIGFEKAANFFGRGIVNLLPQGPIADCVGEVIYIAVAWYFLYFLYKKKIFLRL